MSTVTIRNLDSSVKEELMRRAAENGRSMEAEIRLRLAQSISSEPPADQDQPHDRTLGFGSRIRALFADTDGLEQPERAQEPAPAADFSR